MASNLFELPVYGIGRNAAVPYGAANAIYIGLPSTGIQVFPIRENDNNNFNGVTVKSVVQLISYGTVVNAIQYSTSKTVAEVIALANA